MKTKNELMSMTTIQVRKEASLMKVKGYGNMDKASMIEAILDSQKNINLNDEEEIFTDRHNYPLEVGDGVNCRIGSNWFPGMVTKFKNIEDEQYIFVILETSEKQKMFHSVDVERKNMTKEASTKAEEAKQLLRQRRFEDIKSNQDKEKDAVKIEEPVIEKIEIKAVVILNDIENNGFPITKYHDFLKDLDLRGIMKGDLVSFESNKKEKLEGIVKSFVWDNQDKCAYFTISVNGKVFYKKLHSVNKI